MAQTGNSQAHIRPLHKVLAATPGFAVADVVADVVAAIVAVEGVLVVEAVVEPVVDLGMADSDVSQVERAVTEDFVVVERGCTFVGRAVLVVAVRVVKQSFVSAALVAAMFVLGCCRRNSSLHFQRQILLSGVLVADTTAEEDVVGWRLDVVAEGTTVGK